MLPNDNFRSGEGEGQMGINQNLLKVTPTNINGNSYSILRHKDYKSLLFSKDRTAVKLRLGCINT
jgi:hypothetical protein